MALLIAILLVALGTMIAAAMAYNNAMTARRTLATFDFDQALLVTEGTEAFAAYALQETHKQEPNSTYPAQPWGRPLGPLEVAPGVTLEASLEDLQGRFNLNDLLGADGRTINPVAVTAFRRLLTRLGLEPHWADDLVNWIDASPTPVYPDAPSDSVYLELSPPYYSPHLPITSASEMLALPGFGRKNFEKIAPYVTALPVGTPLNICSASPYVLDAYLGHTEYSADPKQFEKDRTAAGGCFPTLADFQSAYTNTLPGNTQNGGTSSVDFMRNFAQTSSWFLLSSFVSANSTEFAFYSVLERDSTGRVRPILRSDTPD